jgi:hemerythrin-like metal-binding protein
MTEATMPAHSLAEAIPELVWITAFETGNAKVDGQHLELLVDINDLSKRLAEGRDWSQIVNISKQLRDKCFAHFREERTVLKKAKYGRLAVHEREHRHIERQLDDVLACISNVPHPSRGDVEAVLYLRSMLIHHFFRHDIAYKSHLLRARRQRSWRISRKARFRKDLTS